MRGLLITFEGGEGVGKTTQISLLADRLRQRNIAVQLTREPGAGKLGQKLRDILLNDPIAPKAELLLYLADRAQHVHQELTPWLASQQVVLCDRFLDSSEVYQGFARGLGVDFVRQLHHWLLPPIWPGLTLVLDMPAVQGLQRAAARGAQADRLEKENLAFHEKLRQGFLQQAAREPRRISVIDGQGTPQEVSTRVWQQVVPLIQQWQAP